jgi:Rap guanine nucleotide exchange factor 2
LSGNRNTTTSCFIELTFLLLSEQTEYVDNLFELESKFGTSNVSRFSELVNTEMMWVITEVVSETNASRRAKVIKQFIKVAHHCYKETQNFNSMFAITGGLDHGSVKRLKATWEKVPGKYLKLLSEMQLLMDPTMNFRKYRNLIANASARPPLIPIYPMVNKDLTFIHIGNKTHVDGMINFEKLRMLAKEIRTLTNMCTGSDFYDGGSGRNRLTSTTSTGTLGGGSSVQTMRRGASGVGLRGRARENLNAKKMYEESQMVRRVRAYLAKMPVINDEDALHKMSLEVEPPAQPATTAPTLASTTSTTSIKSGLSGQVRQIGSASHANAQVTTLADSTICYGSKPQDKCFIVNIVPFAEFHCLPVISSRSIVVRKQTARPEPDSLDGIHREFRVAPESDQRRQEEQRGSRGSHEIW